MPGREGWQSLLSSRARLQVFLQVSKSSWTYTIAMAKETTYETKGAADGLSDVFGTLNKSVMALAIQPLNTALTLTGRKVYDVMLHIAQTNPSGDDGGWSYPVAGIMHGYGSKTKASERIQRYIELMVQTAVVYRPLAASEASMTLDGFDLPPGKTIEEARTFTLLAEARLYRRGRDWWVTWYFPPTIREQLLNPGRWAQIELSSVARMSTYTGLALYEITARYKESPGGLTSRQTPEFWMEVLREGGELKKREWRKFKNELLMPGIQEINEVTELKVELVEHRTRGAVDAVQFKVSRKPKPEMAGREMVDVSLVIQAQRLGIKEHEFDAMVVKYGAARVADGLASMEAYAYNPAKKIVNGVAYLKTVIGNQEKDQVGQAQMFTDDTVLSEEERVFAPSEKREEIDRAELLKAWMAAKMKALKLEFGSMPKSEQDRWVEMATPAILQLGFMTPNMRTRVLRKEWESPLISGHVLRVYAASKHGPEWDKPSEIDLTLFSVDLRREEEGTAARPAR